MRLLNKILIEKSTTFDLLDNICLLGYCGSLAHGTYIPNKIDDKDLMGIIIPPKEYYFGLSEFGSRGTKEIKIKYWDIVLYELKKYVSLLLKGNPNVLGLLWLPDSLYIKKSEIGKLLIDNRDIFVSKIAYHSFVGYAYNQLKKMTAYTFNGYMGEKRKALVNEFGYDCKNASHLIRLLEMGIEFLKNGNLIVCRKNANILIDIKSGKWSLEKVKSRADELLKTIKDIKNKSKLPEKPDYEKANELLIKMIEINFQYKLK